MASDQLFNRYVRIIAGSLDMTGLDAEFTIHKDLKKEPNRCQLVVYNLNEDNRKALHALSNVTVQIKVGYLGINTEDESAEGTPSPAFNDEESLIFQGDIFQIYSQKDGPDWKTFLNTSDGTKAHKHSRINKCFTKGTSFQQIGKELIGAYQLDGKKAITRLGKGDIEGLNDTTINNYVLSGSVSKELDKLLEKFSLSGSIQNGELLILKSTDTASEDILELGPETGLIGSPEPGCDKLLKIKSLILPHLSPGYKIKVESASFSGLYRIEKVVYNGSTFGNDWYANIEGKPL